METLPAVGLAVVIYWLMTLAKNVTNRNWNGTLTQVVAGVVGVAAVCIYAQTDWAEAVNVGEETLATINGWELALLGVTLGAGAGAGSDVLRAVNTSDPSVAPTLLPDGSFDATITPHGR